MTRTALAVSLGLLFAAAAPAQVRIKDITEVSGARSNQLFGYGLVTGLDGTGSRSTTTADIAVNMLQRNGYTTSIFSSNPAEPIFRSTNNSLVLVTAEIGPYSRRGTKIDVTVSSMDDARSLKGGILAMTPLKGADGQVYAVAQGAVSIGGFSVEGQAARLQKNQLNAGRIPDGAMIEKEAPGEMTKNGRIEFLLKDADYNTARLIAKEINARYPNSAEATDAGRVVVCPPLDAKKTVTEIIAEVGVLEVRPDTTAKVIINERTGTVFAGENVTIGTAAIMHGNLFISTSETPFAIQPNAFARGNTVVLPRTVVTATVQPSRMIVLPRAATVADVARGMNALGVSPQDVMSIFQLLKDGGALNAELRSIR